jgi:hypothetical protein
MPDVATDGFQQERDSEVIELRRLAEVEVWPVVDEYIDPGVASRPPPPSPSWRTNWSDGLGGLMQEPDVSSSRSDQRDLSQSVGNADASTSKPGTDYFSNVVANRDRAVPCPSLAK